MRVRAVVAVAEGLYTWNPGEEFVLEDEAAVALLRDGAVEPVEDELETAVVPRDEKAETAVAHRGEKAGRHVRPVR